MMQALGVSGQIKFSQTNDVKQQQIQQTLLLSK